MEKLVAVLICLPFVLAVFPAIIKKDRVRSAIVYAGCFLVAGVAVAVSVLWFREGRTITMDLPYSEFFDIGILVGDFVLMGIIIALSIKYKKYLIGILSLAQTGVVVWTEINGPEIDHAAHIRLAWLSFIMIMIIGIVGVAIGIYAIGYMRGYHEHHTEFKDRRRFFFSSLITY